MERVLETLKGVKRQGKGWVALCPAHDDHDPSLYVSYGDDGETVVTYCQVGCSQDAVCAAAGLKYRDYFPDRYEPNSTPVGLAEAVYPYVDAEGRPLFEVVRAWDATANDKWIRNRVVDPVEDSGFRWNLKGIRARPLFRLPQVIKAVRDGREIWIVEGEKDVLRLESLGEVATCNHGGAGKWKSNLNHHFKSARVNIVADLDKPGVAHAFNVADSLQGVAEVVIVLAPKIGDTTSIKDKHGEDASDHFDAGGTLTDFRFLDQPESTNGHPPGDNRTDTKPTLVESAVFRPVLIDELVDSLGDGAEESADWLVPGILARGVLSAIGGLPKSGKSTASSYLAKAVAAGDQFWGLPAVQVPALWINFEVSPRLAAWKFRDVGAMGLPLYVWSGTNQEVDLEDIERFVRAEGVGLVLFDSLTRLWRVTDENDAVQTGQAVDLVLQFTRSVDVATLLIAHHRKAGSPNSVDLLRGSNATPATIDIIMALKKRPGGGRKIEFDSRYDETPQGSMIVDIGADGRYNVLGDERSVKYEGLCKRVLEAMGTEPLTTEELADAINEPQTTVRRALDDLHRDDKIGRSGDGKRGSPYRFSRPDLSSTTLDIGAGGKKDEAAS